MSDNRAPEDRIIDFDGRDQATEEEQQKAQDLRREQRKVFLLRMLRDPVGRDWLWDLMQEFNAFGTTFAAGPTGFPDPTANAYYQGRQSCGWRLWREFDDLSPELASVMRREHQGPPNV